MGNTWKGVVTMAETMKGKVVLRSVPNREIGRKVAFYLATINRDMSSKDIATFLARSSRT